METNYHQEAQPSHPTEAKAPQVDSAQAAPSDLKLAAEIRTSEGSSVPQNAAFPVDQNAISLEISAPVQPAQTEQMVPAHALPPQTFPPLSQSAPNPESVPTPVPVAPAAQENAQPHVIQNVTMAETAPQAAPVPTLQQAPSSAQQASAHEQAAAQTQPATQTVEESDKEPVQTPIHPQVPIQQAEEPQTTNPVASPAIQQIPQVAPVETHQPAVVDTQMAESAPQVNGQHVTADFATEKQLSPAEVATAAPQQAFTQEKPATSDAPKPAQNVNSAPSLGEKRFLPATQTRKSSQGHPLLSCDVYQAAIVNVRLPKGFKLESEDVVLKAIHQREIQHRNQLKQAAKQEKVRQQAAAKAAARAARAKPAAPKQPVPQPETYKLQEEEVVKSVLPSQNEDSSMTEQEQKMPVLQEAPQVIAAPINPVVVVSEPMPVLKLAEAQEEIFTTSEPGPTEIAKTVADSAPEKGFTSPQAATEVAKPVQSQPVAVVNGSTPPIQQNEGNSGPPDLAKQPSRTSGRNRNNVNYTSMAQGIGDISASLDYSEVSGTNFQPPKSQAKTRGLKVHQDVMKKCVEFLQLLSSQCASVFRGIQLEVTGETLEEFSKQSFALEMIAKNVHELKYQSTYNMVIDIRKALNTIDKIVRLNPVHREKVLDLQDEVEKTITDFNLVNKDLFTVQQPKPENVDKIKKEQEIQNRREMSQQNKQIKQLQKQVEQMQRKTLAQQTKASAARQAQVPQVAPIGPVHQQTTANLMDTPMTFEEKAFLKNSINLLNPEQQKRIIPIVEECLPPSEDGVVYEFELDQLTTRKCRELEAYVKDCRKQNQKKQKRKEADQKRREKLKLQKQLVASQHQQPPQQANIAQTQPQKIAAAATSVPATAVSAPAPITAPAASAQQQQEFQSQQLAAAQAAQLLQQQQNLASIQQQQNLARQMTQPVASGGPSTQATSQQAQATPQTQVHSFPGQTLQQQNLQMSAAEPAQVAQAQAAAAAQAAYQAQVNQQQLICEQMDNEKLSQLLYQSPNLPISVAKRAEVEVYRNKELFLRQQQQQLAAQQQWQAAQAQIAQTQVVGGNQQLLMAQKQVLPTAAGQVGQAIPQQNAHGQPQQTIGAGQGQPPFGKTSKPEDDQFSSSSSSDSEDDYDTIAKNKAAQGAAQGHDITKVWQNMPQ